MQLAHSSVARALASLLAVFSVGASGLACSSNESPADELASYYPALPAATGAAQVAYAGPITTANSNELLTGPAASGMVGDYFMRNDKARFVISAATRVFGVVPQGGNLIDAALADSSGHQLTEDQFGEMSLLYVLGRTCDPDHVDVVRDGSGGGVAVLRSVGKSANNDYLNIKGIGVFPVDAAEDPTIEDSVLCATTYVLEPGSTTLQVYHSLYNAGANSINGPLGVLADTGGQTESFGDQEGFQRLNIAQLSTLNTVSPINYVVYQAPGTGYGIIPRHPTPTVNGAFLVAGVSLVLLGADTLTDLLTTSKYFMHLAAGAGLTQRYDVVVGHDANDTDNVYRTGNGETLAAVSGTALFSGGGPATDARVGVFVDANNNGLVDDDEKVLDYIDVAADGTFSGKVATTAGALLLRAEVKNIGRSQAVVTGANVTLTVPSPIKVDFSIVDDTTNMNIPSRLIVVGNHPAFPDERVFETYDRVEGVVVTQHNIHGTSTDVGDGADPALLLPAGGSYRIYASRGTEWSVASQPFTATADTSLQFRLRQVAPASGYLATEWHVHDINSPDSNIPTDERVRSAVSAGIEMFAVTDHDFVSDFQPLVESLGLTNYLRVIPGIEVTPFAYGHFNAWPMDVDTTSPNGGAIDWAQGDNGFSMTPGEIYDTMRTRGAQMVQVNHSRASGFAQFQSFFDRANLTYDYSNRTIFGDFANASVPNDWLRLPGEDLWSDKFNGLEIWNGFGMTDSDGDGRQEVQNLDRVTRDWFNMLSMGFVVTPSADSDTHTSSADPMGMPRTYVRVPDDSAMALSTGSSVPDVLATMTGDMPRDLVLTDGPMIAVANGVQPGPSVLGQTITASPAGSPITLTVTMTAADWAQFDTLEVFANETPDTPPAAGEPTSLVPLKCWTSRDLTSFDPKDPCALASMTAESMTVNLVDLGGGFARYEATVTVTLDPSDIVTRAGATGTDAWLVFRVRGNRAIFPIMSQNVITTDTLPVLLAGDPVAVDNALQGIGMQASATTSAIFVDFDGGGYLAPFHP